MSLVEDGLQCVKTRVKSKEPVKIDGRLARIAGFARSRDGNRGTHLVVVLLAVGHQDVEAVRSPAHEDRNEHFLTRTQPGAFDGERGAPQKGWDGAHTEKAQAR